MQKNPWKMKFSYFLIASVILLMPEVNSKVYDRCELARELYEKHKIPKMELSKWLCLIFWESSYDTKAHNYVSFDGSQDHGLFQINDKHWCQPEGRWSANICSLPCEKLRDDDITDDVLCARKIFRTHGFQAWKSYLLRCTGSTSYHLDNCTLQINLLDKPQNISLPHLHRHRHRQPRSLLNGLGIFRSPLDTFRSLLKMITNFFSPPVLKIPIQGVTIGRQNTNSSVESNRQIFRPSPTNMEAFGASSLYVLNPLCCFLWTLPEMRLGANERPSDKKKEEEDNDVWRLPQDFFEYLDFLKKIRP